MGGGSGESDLGGEPLPGNDHHGATLHDARTVEQRLPEPWLLADRYALGPTLGEGGMGEVHECHDVLLDRTVALKSVRRDLQARDLDARFVLEARVQAQLEHPCVVPVYEMGRDDRGTAFFTMRKVQGITLEEVIRRTRAGDAAIAGSFTRHRLLTAFAQVCLTLESAHASGVLHRDLKPANVMFGDFGEIYLLDWGVAKLTGDGAIGGVPSDGAGRVPLPDETQVGTILGTPAYMAPEQFAGHALDARADVFALGALLFEILTLEQLLDDAGLLARSRGGRTTWDARPSLRAPARDVAPEFDRICLRATAEAPEERYASARELHDALEAYLGGERDMDLRRRLAASHLARAEAARSSDPDLALLEVNRALALGADDPRALSLLVELLRSTPASAAKARQEAVSEGIARLRRAQPLGALLLVAPWLTIYPLVAALRGVRDPWLAAVPAIAWALAGVTILIDWRRGSQERVVYPTVFLLMAVAATSLLFGPLFLMPALAVTTIANMVLVSARRLRVLSVALACAAVAIPTGAAWLGIYDVYQFESETRFQIIGIFATFRPLYLSVLLATCDVIMILSAALFAGRFRDEIGRARTENVLIAWQLSKLLPSEANEGPGSADPEPEQPRATGAEAPLRVFDTAIDGHPRVTGNTETSRTSTPAGESAAAGARDLLGLAGPRYVASARVSDDETTETSVCRDRLAGRDVLMKRLLPEHGGRAELEAGFRSEARLQARLDHPGVPPFYDLGRDEEGLWFTTKLVRGSSLAALLRDAPSSQDRQRRLAAFAQVCLTLEFAHNHGITHGALQPASVVLGAFGEVYVVGWGQAGAPSMGGAIDGPALRSGSYAAPEQAAGGGDDVRADVFALGAILYEVIAGRPLFTTDDRFAVVLGKYDARPSALRPERPVPVELDDICAKATAYDGADRYTSARELHDALETFLARDRDVVRRHAIAEERLAQATKRVEDALAAHDDASRVAALREVGRALALAPDRAPALRLLERLLRTPPRALPGPVACQLEAESWAMSRHAAPAAALSYVVLWAGIFPALAWLAGVRELLSVIAVVLAWMVAAALLYMQGQRSAAPRLPWSSIAGLCAVSLTSLVLGPHVIVSGAAIAMTLGYVLSGRAEWRLTIVALGCASVVVPAALTWLGLLHVYDLGPTTPMDTFVIRGALHHPAGKLLPGLMVGNVAAVLVAAAYAARCRDTLEQIDADNRARVLALSRLLS